MNIVDGVQWQELYLSAVAEKNEVNRQDKAEAAVAAMRRRSARLSRRRDTDSILEMQAITAALDKLGRYHTPLPRNGNGSKGNNSNDGEGH